MAIIKRLSPPVSGLMTLQTRRLVHSLFFLLLSYGADLFVPNGAMAQRVDVLWHRALRWAMNCFSSTLVNILAAEGSLPPLPVLFRHKRRMSALTIACTPSSLCPAAARLPKDFLSLFPTQAADLARPPVWKGDQTGPLPWRNDFKSRIRTHLPIDALAYLSFPFLPASGHLPASLLHLLASEASPPAGSPLS